MASKKKVTGGKRPQNLRRTLGQFSAYLGRHRIMIGLVALLAAISALAALFGTYMIRPVVNGLLENGSKAYLAGAVGLTACIYIIGALSTLGYTQLMVRAAQKVLQEIRQDLFAHLQTQPLQYFDTHRNGDLMSLFTNDLDTIQECFGDGIMMFLDAAFLGILALVKMWRMDKLLTGLSMIPMVLLLIIGTIVGRAMMRKWEIRQQAFSDLSDFAQESFSGFAVIKAFVKELKELAAFRKLNVLNENVNVDYTKISVTLNILISLLVESVICVILGYGGYLVYQKKFDAGQLVEYIGYFSSIVWPIMAVSMLIEKTSRGKASLNRVRELLDAEINVSDAPGAVDIGSVKGKIEMRNLNFRYPDGEFDVLRNVSFTIEPGENVGIVGKTGAGKTTLVDLILRIYNVPDGTLFVDGHDVNSVTLHSLRENCSYVPQDNFLFSDTIANNIAFAFDETDKAAVNGRRSLQMLTITLLSLKTDTTPSSANAA